MSGERFISSVTPQANGVNQVVAVLNEADRVGGEEQSRKEHYQTYNKTEKQHDANLFIVKARNLCGTSSWVWKYFSIFRKTHDAEMAGFASCNLCYVCAKINPSIKWAIKFDGSTTKLERHITCYHSHLSDSNRAKVAKCISAESASGPIDKHVVYGTSFSSKFIKWAVLNYQPISICEDASFREMLRSLNSKVDFFSRETVVNKSDFLKIS
jgi:hypothetical protein